MQDSQIIRTEYSELMKKSYIAPACAEACRVVSGCNVWRATGNDQPLTAMLTRRPLT